ncbi:hypothetical protein JYT11_00965 [Planctomycetaceae bacterium AH-315-I19]|nr:hypothetical protein [Planctomycetaceae bacterium AH-315-I19]
MPMPIQRRLAAAAKYKPSTIQLLLVAEAPPCTLDRYFYFDSVDKQDSLFRYVWQGITGEHAGEREHKPIQLAAFRDAGVFLIDLHEKNISKPSPTILRACVPDLIKRARALNPEKIILIKASVYDAAFTDLADAGLPVVDERIPFPGSGQQRKFLEAFTRALAS